MKSYKAIRAQIAKLEQQAEDMRQTQVKSVIAQLKKTIDEYGLTADELGLGVAKVSKAAKGAAPRRARKAAAGVQRKTVGVARYRDPKTGQTWTGRGRPPAWIVDAKDRDAFLIAGAPAAAPEAAKPAATKRAKAAKPAAKAASKRPAGRKPAAKKKAGKARAAVKTPAVQIESGVAME
jgi:DNA-binding protein H-NS